MTTTEDVLAYAPREVNMSEFVRCRVKEMAAMEKAAQTAVGNNLVSQRVPRHMRRRAAGHDTRRLPHRLRDQARREIAQSGATPKTTKKPSRKHRRRPSNLLQEYQRRQRKFVWLETHIWHAKRFHMSSMWGYKVPIRLTDKGVRAAYRGATEHCVIQDVSYVCCLELEGPENELLCALQCLTNPNTGLGFGAKAVVRGTREGRVILYHRDKYPYGALCEVTFLWQPQCCPPDQCEPDVDQGKNNRKLWLWIHPSAFIEAMEEITAVFKAVKVTNTVTCNITESITEETIVVQDCGETSDQLKLNPCYTNGSVTVRSLKDKLCRFRLTGPSSLFVLYDAFFPASVSPSSDSCSMWWKRYYEEHGKLDIHNAQKEVWSSIKSSSCDVPPHTALALTVRDPRLFMPRSKKYVNSDEQDTEQPSVEIRPHHSSSPLWESWVQAEVNKGRLTEHELNRKREEHIVPGTVPDLGDSESRVPILLIQRPGSQSDHSGLPSGLSRGWDVVFPVGWGRAFWIALQYRGARAVGLQQQKSLALEEGQLLFPFMFPDTHSCREEERREQDEREAKYKKMPPAKRRNFTKLGQAAPLHNPWRDLVSEWAAIMEEEPDEDFYVLRNRKHLRQLQALCGGQHRSGAPSRQCGPPQSKTRKMESSVEMLTSLLLEESSGCLVTVRLVMLHRGVPSALATICIPTQGDLDKLAKNSKFGGPVEQAHPDPVDKLGAKERKVERLAGVQQGDSVVSAGDRTVIGRVAGGQFSFSHGQGSGLGFVTLAGLCRKLGAKQTGRQSIVLVRQNHSTQYRFAYLTVVTQV